MLTKPFNEDFLWKGKLQRAQYPPAPQKARMILPKYNTLTGKPYPTKYSLHDEQCLSAYEISKNYWAGERKRRQVYREQYKLSAETFLESTEKPPVVYNAIFRLA